MRPTAHYCASRDARFTLASPRRLKASSRDCREPAGIARASLHRGRTDREGRGLWGKAGQRSLERSALVEAVEQLTRALDQIATLPATPALRREQIKLQVALINALMHVKGYAAPETKAAMERARSVHRASGSARRDSRRPIAAVFGPLRLLGGELVAFNGERCCDLAAQFLTLAEKQRATVPLMIGHRLMGTSLVYAGDVAGGRAHLDHAIELYDPAEHRALTTRFGPDSG